MKKIVACLLCLMMVLSLTVGCGQKAAQDNAEDGNAEEATAKIGVVLGIGGLGDKSFNDNGYAGIVRAKDELGIAFDYVEPKDLAEFETYHREFSQDGQYDLIIGLGFDQADAIKKVAQEFPEQKFLLIDGVVEAPNVASAIFKDYEKACLIGAFAGQVTKTNKVGVVGGMDIPLINAFVAGYQAGAKYINSDAEVLVNYVGAWKDPNTAKEMAISMYDKGADIVLQAAGGSGLGVFSAAEEKDKYAIGADVNQNALSPDHIVVSAVRRLDNVIFDQIKKVVDGNWESGVFNLGLKEEAVSYALEDSNIEMPQEYIDKVEELKAKIIAGELVIPNKIEDVDKFLTDNK